MDIDSELWTKKTQLLQLLGNRQFNNEDLEVDDDDARSDFACPYCEDDFDIISLCSHLVEEHCSDGKLSMCPVCAAQVEDDVIGHINAQHANLLKGSQKTRLKKPIEISSNLEALLEATRATSSTDSFLQSLVSVSTEVEEPENSQEEMIVDELRALSLESPEEKEKRFKQTSCRAEFARHLVLSTIWPDS